MTGGDERISGTVKMDHLVKCENNLGFEQVLAFSLDKN
jgi:hypothetical protein